MDKGLRPDSTYFNVVVEAVSILGLVDKGLRLFARIVPGRAVNNVSILGLVDKGLRPFF